MDDHEKGSKQEEGEVRPTGRFASPREGQAVVEYQTRAAA